MNLIKNIFTGNWKQTRSPEKVGIMGARGRLERREDEEREGRRGGLGRAWEEGWLRWSKDGYGSKKVIY